MAAAAMAALAWTTTAQGAEPEATPAGSSESRIRGPLLTVLGGATVVGGATLVAWEFVPREGRPPSWPRAGWGVVAAGMGLQSAGIALWQVDRHTADGGIEDDRDLLAGGGLLTGVGGACSVVGLVLGYLSLGQPTGPGEKGGSVYGTSLSLAGSALVSLGVPMLWLARGSEPGEGASIQVGPTSGAFRVTF